jgi:hypothetical protein
MKMMRHHLNKFSRGNDPLTGMGLGLQQYVESWLEDHKISYDLADFKRSADENGNTVIEMIADRNFPGKNNIKGEVKIVFSALTPPPGHQTPPGSPGRSGSAGP